MTDTRTAAAAPRSDYPAAAGRVASGTGSGYVHLALLVSPGEWATACPADSGWRDGATDPDSPEYLEGRHVWPVLELVDCPDCLADAEDLVDAVNRVVAGQKEREAEARALLGRFFAWAASECPVGDGGAVLAVYDGGTRLHPMRPDERARTIEAWLESSRVYPGG